MKTKRIAAIAVAAATLLSACEYKELVMDSSEFRPVKSLCVGFDWKNVDSIPTGMRVAFYPSEANKGYTLFDVSNGTTCIDLPVGMYDVTAWNNDIEHVFIEGIAKRERLYATTGNYSPHGTASLPHLLDSLYQGQRVLDYPDYMVHANRERFEVEDNQREQMLTLSADSMVVTIDVVMHGIKGLEWVNKIRGAVNNIAGKRYIAYEDKTEELVTIMFDGECNAADSCVTARFWVFGIEPDELTSQEHKMTMFFWTRDGQLYLTMDVTDALSRVKAGQRFVEIEEENLDIDLRDFMPHSGAGIVIDAEDWSDPIGIDLSF